MFARSLLEREGIEYVVYGENLQDLFGAGRLGGYNPVAGPTEFRVRTCDAELARALLDGLSGPLPEHAADSNDDA
jgi:hypothetical protein